MNHTFSNHILTQLRSSGFSVEKCPREKEWQLLDKAQDSSQVFSQVLLRSSSLGQLTRMCAKEFGLDWK
jgi:hypothetical protein